MTVTAAPRKVVPVAAFTQTTAGLKVNVDGSSLTDSDGQVVAYSWKFGDGSTSVSGAQQSHTYPAAGTYDVELTVTDDENATNVIVQQVTVEPANELPVASFQTSAVNLNLSVDGSASTDPDGTVSKFEWTFGDGGTALGAVASHSYNAGGTYTVSLKVTDNKGATSVTDAEVTVAPAASNQAPVADFNGVVTDLKVSVDASASSDPDGTVAAYSWQFGTTGSAQGKVASYQFAAPGTYPDHPDRRGRQGGNVVQDDRVHRDSSTHDRAVRQRSIRTDSGGGMASADLGGAWSTVGAAENLAVTNGGGVLNLTSPASQAGTYLAGSVNTSSDITVRVSANKNGSGPGTYVSVIGRRVNANNQYRVRVRYAAGNRVGVSIIALKGSTSEVQIAPEVLLPGSIPVGTVFNVRFQVFGTSPTQLKTKVWAVGSAEPADWLLTATDSTAALQVGGALGFMAYLSSKATNAPVAVRIQDFSTRPVI